MHKRPVYMMVLLISLCGRTAAAQEAGKSGLTMGTPAGVGVLWHVTDAIAVRPEISFARVSNDLPSVKSTSWTLGLTGSALFYVSKRDNLRTYVSPRFSYSKLNNNIETGPVSSTRGSVYGVSGSYGAQYSFGRQFAGFGEVGLTYSHQTSKSSSTLGQELNSDAWGTRSAVGVILYF